MHLLPVPIEGNHVLLHYFIVQCESTNYTTCILKVRNDILPLHSLPSHLEQMRSEQMCFLSKTERKGKMVPDTHFLKVEFKVIDNGKQQNLCAHNNNNIPRSG